MNSYFLSLCIVMPFLGSLLVVLNPKNARRIALLTALITFAVTVNIAAFFNPHGPSFQFEEYRFLGYHVGIDGLSMALMLLSSFLILLCLWMHTPSHQSRSYLSCFLVLEGLVMGTFTSLNLIFFYIFFEASLIPLYFLIGIWGGPDRIRAATKFFLYTLAGSVLMLVAIAFIFGHSGTLDLVELKNFSPSLQRWLWLGFFASFAIKTPLWPFHTWLPLAHVEAPTAVSVVLAAVLLKLGTYGFARISLPLFPEASVAFAPLIYTLSVIGILSSALIAWQQNDMKRVIAYSSISHMGIVTLGLFSFDPTATLGAFYQMLSHGVISAALFFSVGVLYDRCHTRLLENYGGIARMMPRFAVLFLIFTLGSLGMPGTSGFVGEFLVIVGMIKKHSLCVVGIGGGLFFATLYGMRLYRKMMGGAPKNSDISDLTPRELFILGLLAFVIVGLGLKPPLEYLIPFS